MEQIYCSNCKVPLTGYHEIEYSLENNEFYCSPRCAQDAYFAYMQSIAVILNDKGKTTEVDGNFIYRNEEEYLFLDE
jgi:hypothetical protein